MQTCPFQAGDLVIYRPSPEGKGRSVMTDFGKLEPGERYKVARIVEDAYLVLEGFDSGPSVGLHWSEFERDQLMFTYDWVGRFGGNLGFGTAEKARAAAEKKE